MSGVHLPPDFLWGFATASYQIEGAVDKDGRADSIWDEFCRLPGKIADGTTGDVACDSYNRYKDDIAILKSLGARAYRFSISWSRVIPLGGRQDPINNEGLKYYSKLVDALIADGIIPVVTLFHWDLPQSLHKRYGGFLDQAEFIQDYLRYARMIFQCLGDRVQYWITFNEPWCIAMHGYGSGVFAPGRSSDRTRCAEGDSSIEPWVVGHTILVAHGAAVRLYRQEFQPKQGGQIAITLNGDWAEPWDASNAADIAAAQRKLEFSIAWFADPIYLGDYPESMRHQLGERLPNFSKEDRALVLDSNDFYGMNHYTADFIQHRSTAPPLDDQLGNVELLKTNCNGESVGPETACDWLRPHPEGFRKLLSWISNRYGRPVIYVTENGTSVRDECKMPREVALQDDFRAQYFKDYINAMAQASCFDNVDIRGYMAWSLLEYINHCRPLGFHKLTCHCSNFEWAEGYETRFGVTYVDYENGQARYAKRSAKVIQESFAILCGA